ncbi:hypothetical protein EG68_12192 [Paragonimus skrjabini miyazakii]|uniref:Uncharacterized protein n=1 Tax=Paragonimus skrjabini miyazakii TaxID=59628 RepID=A0A8S9YBI7_9TREM|nr:hypothetical protein EG68_12192 [Paragonimus skrjabini miyazakii]
MNVFANLFLFQCTMKELTEFSFRMPTTGKYEWNDEANTIVFKKYAVTEKSAKIRATVQGSNELDQLILAFAQYFDTHFKILDFTERFAESRMLPNSVQILEQEEYKGWIQKCLGDLAQVYAHFLMQERRKYLEVNHVTDRSVNPEHQARQDRCLFDTIYWFLVFAIWVMFSRKRFKIICAEIGWFTRSEMFNSIGRLGSVQCGRDSSHGDSLTSSYRKNLHRTNMVNQRSPACKLLLPKPSESAAYLFHSEKITSPEWSHKTAFRSNVEKISANRDGFRELDFNKVNVKFGILGDELSSYDEQLIANSVDRNQLVNIEEQTGIQDAVT